MAILITLTILSFAGITAVFWLLKHDKESQGDSLLSDHPTPGLRKNPILDAQEESQVDEGDETRSGKLTKFTSLLKKAKPSLSPDSKKTPNLLTGLFNKTSLGKLKMGKKESPQDDLPGPLSLASGGNHLGEKISEIAATDKNQLDVANEVDRASTNTTEVKTYTDKLTDEATLSRDEEKNIEQEINLSSELNDLKEKYNKLESLFNEKSDALAKAQESLDYELKNRKEFNKIKDVLEKELREAKDKSRNLQVELNNEKAEGERHQKRVNILEDKITRLEKDIREKEDKIDELVKRLQTFASPSMSVKPPAKESPILTEESAAANPPEKDSQPIQPARGNIDQPTPTDQSTPASHSNNLNPSPSEDALQAPEPKKSVEHNNVTRETDFVRPKNGISLPGKSMNTQTDHQDAQNTNEIAQEESYLKLQPDILSDNPKNSLATQPSEKKIFKIIEPDNFLKNYQQNHEDKNSQKERE